MKLVLAVLGILAYSSFNAVGFRAACTIFNKLQKKMRTVKEPGYCEAAGIVIASTLIVCSPAYAFALGLGDFSVITSHLWIVAALAVPVYILILAELFHLSRRVRFREAVVVSILQIISTVTFTILVGAVMATLMFVLHFQLVPR